MFNPNVSISYKKNVHRNHLIDLNFIIESYNLDHPLARHCDILTAIETRISLLGMTFMKFIELDLCCFIPGKVIDEIYSVLRNIQSIKNPNRSCEVLQVYLIN